MGGFFDKMVMEVAQTMRFLKCCIGTLKVAVVVFELANRVWGRMAAYIPGAGGGFAGRTLFSGMNLRAGLSCQ